METIDDNRCFVCGKKNNSGLQLDFSASDGTSHCVTEISERFQGWKGMVHGGIIASMLDEAVAYACFSKDIWCVTAELSVKYKKPVPVGGKIEITGEMTGHKGRIVYAEAVVKQQGVVLAAATARLFQVEPPKE